MTCRLSLTITCSRSLRCYAAGATYEVVDAISQHNQIAADENQIVLDILIGTRTGAGIVAILGQTLAQQTEPAVAPYDHALYRAFVNEEELPPTTANCDLGNQPMTVLLRPDLCAFANSNPSPKGKQGYLSVGDSIWLRLRVPSGEQVRPREEEREIDVKLPVGFGKTMEWKELSDLLSIQNSVLNQARFELRHEVAASTEGNSSGGEGDVDTLLALATSIAEPVDRAVVPESRLLLFVGSSFGFSEACCMPVDRKKVHRCGQPQDARRSPQVLNKASDVNEVTFGHCELAGPQLEAAEQPFGRYYRDHDYNVGRRHAHTLLTQIGRRSGSLAKMMYTQRSESLASGPRMTLWLSR